MKRGLVSLSTAAAIAAAASNERGAILDGNVKRVIARHRGIEGWPGNPRIQASLWEEAERLLPKRGDIARYTQGMMDLGATICLRAKPGCNACPINDDCVARREGRVHELPTPRPKKKLPRRAVVVLLIEHGDRILLERRPPTGVWPGLLGLPEAAIGDDIASTIGARFGATTSALEQLPSLTHVFTHFALEMRPVRVVLDAPMPQAAAPSYQWLPRSASTTSGVPAPVRRLLRSLG